MGRKADSSRKTPARTRRGAARSPARRRAPVPFPIAVVGASAGGLEALNKLLGALREDSGIGFVLIPHLDPHHESSMVELLASRTPLPVVEARHRARIEPNHVYVIPPNRYLAIDDGTIVLSRPPGGRGSKPSIDFAMCSLALDRQEAAIGIVLSGTGAHGTEGAQEIKRAGGLVIVQEPKSAEHAQMPESAIAAGVADFVLPPEKMAGALAAYVGRTVRGERSAESDQARDGLTRVLAIVEARTGFQFHHYRKRMLSRRVRRRMALLGIGSFAAYAKRLRGDAGEVASLREDLLIGVTGFFRDTAAFEALAKHVVPALVERAHAGAPVRVWVPGCATGEEAYSIAILLFEGFLAAGKPPSIQIFATDVEAGSLDVARRGLYSADIAEAVVSQERLRTFFTRHGEQLYQVAPALRDAVLFARHDLIADPPFSNLDLVSCRNVLIYLEPEVQAKLLSLFHAALNDGGCLLLGSAEAVGHATAMFEPVVKKWHLFRRIGSARRAWPALPIATGAARPGTLAALEPRPRTLGFAAIMQKVLAEEFAPASALIDRSYEILCLQGRVAGYLEFPPGEPSRNLLAMARSGLRAKIQAACQTAISEDRVVIDQARVLRNGVYVPSTVTVRPIKEPREGAGLLLVVLQDQRSTPLAEMPHGADAAQAMLVRELESELLAARQDLLTTVADLQASNEELRTSNEEVTSMNEALHAANEELETSKEELQALNEELGALNARLREKVEESDKASDDLLNLVTATDIATVFLDTELRIKRFTPSIRNLVNLLETDIGRPFQSLATRFRDEALITDAAHVIATLEPAERQVAAVGRWYLRRISPYQASDGRIGGVVITFVDVTQLRELTATLERRTALLEASERRIRAVLDATADAIVSIDKTGVIETFNAGAEKMFGYTAAEALGRDVGLLMPSPYREQHAEYLRRYRQTGTKRAIGRTRELQALRKDGTEFPIRLTVSEVAGLDLFTGIAQDITEQKAMQAEIVEIATLEQRRIGHELHDNTQQELLGLGLLAEDLREKLAARDAGAEAKLAAKLAAGIADANRHVRDLSRGLVPQTVEAAGLGAALADLAAITEERHGVECRFEHSAGLDVGNGVVATHLYRIAQEAVGNAVKHADAARVAIKLYADAGDVRLEVSDDGRGITAEARRGGGLGLRIMEHRCELIGGKLRLAQRDGGGTVVACVVPKERVEAETAAAAAGSS